MGFVTTVCAVIVTYNRSDKVTRVVDNVLAQSRLPEQVLIIDNASTDDTREVLGRYADNDRVTVVTLPTNTGGAGGFSSGMARAYEQGYDFVWIMDDDCYPDPAALEELLVGLEKAEASMDLRLPYACSVVKWTDGDICEMNNPGATWDWGRLLVRGQDAVLVGYCSFVSVLIPRWVMARYGLPLEEYFIWFDDREYTLRIGKTAPGVQCLRSTVVHDLGENRGVNFEDVTESNIWKFEYGVRNEASYRMHREDLGAVLRFIQRTLHGLSRGKVPWALRRRVLKALFSGIRFNPQPKFPKSVL
jgi:GT2 family glycosyltransferase